MQKIGLPLALCTVCTALPAVHGLAADGQVFGKIPARGVFFAWLIG